MEKFWQSFARGYAASGVVPPSPSGLARLRLDIRNVPEELAAEPDRTVRLWIPRGHLRDKGEETHIVGPLRAIGNANKRKPGVIQTIDLISSVSPEGKHKDSEIRVLALAGLHFLITQKLTVSADIHDIATQLIETLRLNDHPSGWGTRTSRTLPLQGQALSDLEIQTDIEQVGKTVGTQVGQHLHAFVPGDVTLRPVRAAHAKDYKEVSGLLSEIKDPTTQVGTLSWRMMTSEKVSKLVWMASLAEIAGRYGVSDTAVRKYCAQNGVDVPTSGYWRMAEKTRAGLKILLDEAEIDDIERKLSKAPLSQVAGEYKIPLEALRAYCRLKRIEIPDGRRRRAGQ